MSGRDLYRLQEAARLLGVSYPTIKQWIYKGRIRSWKTPGGHHRIPAAEVDRLAGTPEKTPRARGFQRISARNQLVGRVVKVKIDGLLAQVELTISGQRMTALITADAAREMKLKRRQTVKALINNTKVMIVRL